MRLVREELGATTTRPKIQRCKRRARLAAFAGVYECVLCRCRWKPRHRKIQQGQIARFVHHLELFSISNPIKHLLTDFVLIPSTKCGHEGSNVVRGRQASTSGDRIMSEKNCGYTNGKNGDEPAASVRCYRSNFLLEMIAFVHHSKFMSIEGNDDVCPYSYRFEQSIFCLIFRCRSLIAK